MGIQTQPASIARPPPDATTAQTLPWLWRIHPLELLSVAALLCLIVVVATGISQPRIRAGATSQDDLRYLSRFWPREQNEAGAYRWSRTEAALRLFGLEQRAPVMLQARLSASRKPGLPLVQLTIGGTNTPATFPINREWRRYRLLLPAPPRDDEVRTIALHSDVNPPHEKSRDLGFALDWVEVAQAPQTWADRLPDPRRLVFLVLLGLLGYMALRRFGIGVAIALTAMLAPALALGAGIAIAPGQVAYWLPNLWLALLISWLALLLPFALARYQRARGGAHAARTAGALLAIGAAQALLPLQRPWSSAIGWALLACGSLALAGSAPAEPPADEHPISGRAAALALLGCTLLALLVRLVGLDRIPVGMWRDEARHGLLALRILHDPTFRPVYVPVVADIPALLFYLAAAPVGLLGAHPWTIRLIPALAGALTPLALYFTARPLFGARAALLAALLLATSAWHISLSRLGFAATLSALLTLVALGLLWRTLQAGGRRLIAAALAGCATGLALYTYHPARLTPLVVALAAMLALGRDARAWRQAAPRLALLAAVALAVAAPLINYALTHPRDYNRRVNETSIFNPDALAGHAPAALVEQNLRLSLGMWNERGDRIGRHNLPNAPMLDPLTGAVFAAGAGLALVRLREPRARLLLLWLGVALIPSLFSIETPNAVRAVETIAPSLILASSGGWALAAWWARAGARGSLSPNHHDIRAPRQQGSNVSRFLHPGSRSAERAITFRRALLAGLLVCVLILNLTRYFLIWPQAPSVAGEFFVADTHIGELVQRLAAAPEIASRGYRIFVPAEADNDVIAYLTDGTTVGTFKGAFLSAPPGDRALLIAYGDSPTAQPDAARRLLGDGAALLGAGPASPLTGRPEFVVYGRGEEAGRVVQRMLFTN